jgi:hypothetical protein
VAAALVGECLAHLGVAVLPAGYDALALVGAVTFTGWCPERTRPHSNSIL